MLCTDVCKCKDCSKDKQNHESNSDNLVEQEEANVCYDSDYSDDSKREYI